MGLLIKNGALVAAGERWPADIFCVDGRIAAVNPGPGSGGEPGATVAPGPGDRVLDAAGRLVFPGGVDPHVHLALPVMGTVSADDFASGSRAAVAGGTTSFIDFVHPERGQDWIEALTARRAEAAVSGCDYALHMAVTWWGDGAAEMMRRCVEEEGITSFKLYMAYKDSVGLDDDDLLRVLEAGARLGVLFVVHAELGDEVDALRDRFAAEGRLSPRYHPLSRPPELEGRAVAHIAEMARRTGARLYIVHVTCRESVDALRAARARGQDITGETCPHYLLLDDSVYEAPGFDAARYVLSPPLRARENQAVLWEALRDGTLDVVATDHCPFCLAQKEAGIDDFRRIPNGAAGIEHRPALLYSHGVRENRISLERFVEVLSEAPARLFGLAGRKGSLRPGADADLVIWDPDREAVISAATHHHRTDLSIYEGFRVRGGPAAVVVGGRVVYEDGILNDGGRRGRYLSR